MRKRDLNIMRNVKIIDNLKAQLIRVIGDFYTLLTRGSNVAEEAIVECIAGAIIILYVLGEKLGYSLPEIDHEMKKKLDFGIRSEDEVEKEGKSLSKLKEYISNRRD
ncbi:MazG-like family protein [Clostridium sp.]|uniref:MazG-like family protein n=1 Tax=Clostridium sp. TaxID=1506 RepID=UPI0026DAC5EE|nr:MazG-like family protein [Clostridium sp.]MDO5039277.1 MazG-like family protein [Clostridium sp.]